MCDMANKLWYESNLSICDSFNKASPGCEFSRYAQPVTHTQN